MMSWRRHLCLRAKTRLGALAAMPYLVCEIFALVYLTNTSKGKWLL